MKFFQTFFFALLFCELSAQWNLQSAAIPYTWTYDACFHSTDTGYAVGQNGVYKTTNGATSWTVVPLGDLNLDNGGYNSVDFPNAAQGCVVGRTVITPTGMILMTHDGGQTWASFPLGNVYSNFIEVDFPSTQIGYVVGANGEIFKSVNNGNSWQQLSSPTTRDLYSVYFLDPLNGFIGGDTLLMKTTDGGNTWGALSGSWTQIQAIQFLDAMNGYVIDDGIVFKTINGGISWNVSTLNTGLISDIYFENIDTGYAITSVYTGIFKTIDGGGYWSVEASDPTSNPITSITFSDDTTGYITGGNGVVLKTSNAGGPSFFPYNDAAIDSLLPTICTGNQPVNLLLSNDGINPLLSVQINWEIDNIQQPTYQWFGNLAPGNSSIISIGTFNFTSGLHTVSVATSNPNGFTDDRPANDSLSTSIISANCSYNDGGVVRVNSPSGFLSAPGLNNVLLNIKNFGVNTISNIDIHWEINNTIQPTFSWSGTLVSGDTSGSINIGQYNFQPGTNLIKAWTESPNNAADYYNNNDTILFSVFVCNGYMNGTYFIGGPSRDFNQFTDAVSALTSCGVNGPVEINISPGTYFEQITIPAISGASSVNTITFQSLLGDSSSVILTYALNSSNYSQNFTLLLNGAQFLIFKKITIASTDTTYYYIVNLFNNASNNRFSNCRIMGVYQPYISGPSGTLIQDELNTNSNESFNIFNNNYLLNGYYGIKLSGAVSQPPQGNTITSNIIEVTHRAIYCSTQTNLIISGNDVTVSSLDIPINQNDFSYGIIEIGSSNLISITNNKVNIPDGGFRTGIHVQGSQGNPMALVANNFITVNTIANAWSHGLYSNSARLRIYNNSIILTGVNNNYSSALTLNNNGNQTEVFNNIICSQAGGDVINTTSTLFTSDYNDIFPVKIIWQSSTFTTLSSWQGTGNDLNSFSINPPFIGAPDLHLQSWNNQLDGMGIPLSSIVDDIDGEVRDTIASDIGADEYLPNVVLSNNESEHGDLLLYPNPLNSTLTIEGILSPVEITIINSIGEQVHYSQLNGNSINIDMRSLNPGVYFIHITNASGVTITKKIIKI